MAKVISAVGARILAERTGWGRIHVAQMPPEHGKYLAKYLSKERPECLKRSRLWAAFGEGWEPTRAKDVKKESLFSKIYQACKEWKQWEGREGFFDRMAFARRMMFMTIENGWTPGLGPEEKPYWMCCDEELVMQRSDVVAPF